MADKPVTPSAPENPLPGTEDSLPKPFQRASHENLFESIMHSGGEPFGPPMGPGVTTLTQKTVRKFKKRGHFFISTYEDVKRRSRNPFTKAGSTNMLQPYSKEALAFAQDPTQQTRSAWQRLLDWLWP